MNSHALRGHKCVPVPCTLKHTIFHHLKRVSFLFYFFFFFLSGLEEAPEVEQQIVSLAINASHQVNGARSDASSDNPSNIGIGYLSFILYLPLIGIYPMDWYSTMDVSPKSPTTVQHSEANLTHT